MEIVKLTVNDEKKLRRWLLSYDSELAMHHQLRSYFLADTDQFGALACIESDVIKSVALFSHYGDYNYVHQFLGDPENNNELVSHLGTPCWAFFREDQLNAPMTGWTCVLKITPGLMLDHPVFSTVFSRSVPRFAGCVYERLN